MRELSNDYIKESVAITETIAEIISLLGKNKDKEVRVYSYALMYQLHKLKNLNTITHQRLILNELKDNKK